MEVTLVNRALFFLPLLAALTLHAQDPTAVVVGRVTDPTGGVVAGVKIQIVNLDTNRRSETASNSAGDYTVTFLNPGRYSLAAEASGFHTYRRPEFTLRVDQSCASISASKSAP
jgi:carboxypeptidase family protein